MNFFRKAKLRAMLRQCDYILAGTVIKQQYYDEHKDTQINRMIDQFWTNPGFEEAIKLIKHNELFVYYFTESCHGGLYVRKQQSDPATEEMGDSKPASKTVEQLSEVAPAYDGDGGAVAERHRDADTYAPRGTEGEVAQTDDDRERTARGGERDSAHDLEQTNVYTFGDLGDVRLEGEGATEEKSAGDATFVTDQPSSRFGKDAVTFEDDADDEGDAEQEAIRQSAGLIGELSEQLSIDFSDFSDLDENDAVLTQMPSSTSSLEPAAKSQASDSDTQLVDEQLVDERPVDERPSISEKEVPEAEHYIAEAVMQEQQQVTETADEEPRSVDPELEVQKQETEYVPEEQRLAAEPELEKRQQNAETPVEELQLVEATFEGQTAEAAFEEQTAELAYEEQHQDTEPALEKQQPPTEPAHGEAQDVTGPTVAETHEITKTSLDGHHEGAELAFNKPPSNARLTNHELKNTEEEVASKQSKTEHIETIRTQQTVLPPANHLTERKRERPPFTNVIKTLSIDLNTMVKQVDEYRTQLKYGASNPDQLRRWITALEKGIYEFAQAIDLLEEDDKH